MRLSNMPEAATDFSFIPAVTRPGASGTATTRAHRAGEAQLRIVEYSPAYLADHWCAKGHVLYVISGALVIEHEDGTPPAYLCVGMTWHVADDETPAHRVRTEEGATVFILD